MKCFEPEKLNFDSCVLRYYLECQTGPSEIGINFYYQVTIAQEHTIAKTIPLNTIDNIDFSFFVLCTQQKQYK